MPAKLTWIRETIPHGAADKDFQDFEQALTEVRSTSRTLISWYSIPRPGIPPRRGSGRRGKLWTKKRFMWQRLSPRRSGRVGGQGSKEAAEAGKGEVMATNGTPPTLSDDFVESLEEWARVIKEAKASGDPVHAGQVATGVMEQIEGLVDTWRTARGNS